MSLTVIVLNEDKIIMSADSRGSEMIDGIHYAADDTVPKIYAIDNDKIIFTCGTAIFVISAINEFKKSKDKSIENLVNISRRIISQLDSDPTLTEDIKNRECKIDLIIGTFEEGKAIIYNISHRNDFRIDKIKGDAWNQIIACGTHIHEASDITKNFDGRIPTVDLYKKVYDTVSSEQVGGTLTMYTMTKNGIQSENKYKINDSRPIRYSDKYVNLGKITTDEKYNKLHMSATEGLVVTRSDSMVRVKLSAAFNDDGGFTSGGFKAEKNVGTSSNPNWVTTICIDNAGDAYLAGTVKAKDFQDLNGNSMLIDNKTKIRVEAIETERLVVGDNIQMGANAKISWGNVTSQPFIPDSGYITQITNNTVNTTFVNALNVTSGRVTVKSGYTTLLDGFNDTNGGVLKIYDTDGLINAKIGVESGVSSNEGGTLILYKDSPYDTAPNCIPYQRVEAGIVNGSGLMNLRDSNAKARVSIVSESSFPYIGLRDSNENLKTYLTETNGYINGSRILTEDDIASIVAKFA